MKCHSLLSKHSYSDNLKCYQQLLFRYQFIRLQASDDDTNPLAKQLIELQRELFVTPSSSVLSNSQKMRDISVSYNWWRLFIIRIIRVLKCLGLVVSPLISALINYLAWVSYIPRLTINLFNLIKNTCSVNGIDAHERWQLFKYFLDKRWFEIANDLVWLVTGLITCFVASASVTPFVLVGLYLFDVIAMYVKNKYYANLRAVYYSDLKGIDTNWCDSIIANNLRVQSQKDSLSFLTTILFFVGMVLCIPMPILGQAPMFIGALLVVATCIYSYVEGSKLDAEMQSLRSAGCDHLSIILSLSRKSSASVQSVNTNVSTDCTKGSLSRFNSQCNVFKRLKYVEEGVSRVNYPALVNM